MAHSLRSRLKELWRRGMLRDGDLERIFIIPKDATNGDVIQASFPNASVYEHGSTYSINNVYNFNSTWWNAPYKKKE